MHRLENRSVESDPKRTPQPSASVREVAGLPNAQQRTRRRRVLDHDASAKALHGVRSRWPRSALDRARFVMAMRAQGHTLDAIAEMIREKWGAEDAGA